MRTLLATALALLSTLGLVACGGGGGGEDVTGDLTARQLLDRSVAEAAELESFRVAVDAEGTIDLAAGASAAVGGLLDGPIAISGEGPVQPPDRASLDTTIELAAFAPQVNISRVGDEAFLSVFGQDFRLDLTPAQVALLDIDGLYPTLTGWMTEPAETAREEIDGTPTVKVSGGVDAVAAFADLAPLLGGDPAEASDAALEAAVEEGTVEVWIGTEDLRPRRIHLVLKADGTDVVEGVGAIDIDLTATLSAFDEPVDITAPSDARPFSLDDLGGLTGG